MDDDKYDGEVILYSTLWYLVLYLLAKRRATMIVVGAGPTTIVETFRFRSAKNAGRKPRGLRHYGKIHDNKQNT